MPEFMLVINNGYEELEKVDLSSTSEEEAVTESIRYVAEKYPEKDESWTLALKETKLISTF